MLLVIYIINRLSQLLILIIIIDVVLSYFMSPFHPIRRTLDRVVEPMLYPIRRIVPSLGMIDISPIILILLVQVLGRVIITLLSSFL